MSSKISIDAFRKDNKILFMLYGRLVIDTCNDTKSRLNGVIDSSAEEVYVNLENLEFIDSAGLGVFVSLKQTANRNGSHLVLMSPAARVEEVFRVSKLDTIFEIKDGPDAEVLTSSLVISEACIWSDTHRMANVGSNEARFTQDESNLTELPASEREDENSESRRLEIKSLCEEAVVNIKKGEYEEAIEKYTKVLRMEPQNMTALNNLGIVYEKRPGWYSLARETWEKVLNLSSDIDDQKHVVRAQKHLDALTKLGH